MPVFINGSTGISGTDGSAGTPAVQGTDTNTGVFFPAADTIAFAEGGVEAMRIDASANVGIGTSSPGNRLHVSGSTNASSGVSIQSTGASGRRYTIYSDSAGGLGFFDDTAGTERVRIDSSGNVGIATASPAARLDVRGGNGTGGVTSPSGTWAAQVLMNQDAIGYNGLAVANRWAGTGSKIFEAAMGWNGSSPGYYPVLTVDGVGQVIFMPQRSEAMRITSTGQVYVGTSSGFDVTSGATTQLSGQCAVFSAGSGPNTLMSFYNSSQSARVGFIGSSGNSTSYNSGSDYRLKDNIVNISGAAAVVNSLRPVTFTWKVSPETGTFSGFIAHELQGVWPEAVVGEKDAICSDGVTPDYQMVDQSKLVPLLTAALQEALTKIDALETRIAALEGASA